MDMLDTNHLSRLEMMRMTEFRVGRGHDGPARVGEYIMGNSTFETPLLIGPESSGAIPLHYRTLGRDSGSTSPMIVAVPFGMNPEELVDAEVSDSDSILLPSLPSFASLTEDAGVLLLQYQLEFIDKIQDRFDTSCLIIRVPEVINLEEFKLYVQEFDSRGIRAAAFVFDGLLGTPDLESIVTRSVLPASWICLALGKITPSLLPLLHYVGFDIIDSGYALEAAATRYRLWRNDIELIESGKSHRYCSCINCVSFNDESESRLTETLQNHNLDVFSEVQSETLHAMENGQLRWLVESMTHVDPNHATFLRGVDKLSYDFLEEFTPTAGAKVVPLIGPESYNSPVVRRYRENLASRYTPPSGKRIVLLLPCSAKKPYSDSKSHRRFLETIESALGNSIGNVAQVILTSPLGIVPRELERIFPAANYDIPVTGDWDAEETQLGADALVSYLNKVDSDVTVVAHVSGGYLGIVRAAESRVSQSIIYTTPEASATSKTSRQALYETLIDIKEILGLKGTPPSHLEEIMRATADFQFGSGAGSLLIPDGAKLGGKPYRQIVCRIDKDQVCSFIADAGSLSLTLNGAKLLAPLNRYWVRLDAPQVKGGSIFAVGISEADPNIRPGDEVIVLNNDNQVIAVGKSEMSGREMCVLSRGRAVTIRHKVE